MDRWQTAGAVFALSLGSCALLGIVAGLASRVSESGVSLLRSAMIVAIASIVGSVFSICINEATLLVGALVGIAIGGILVILTGLGTNTGRPLPKQNDETSAAPRTSTPSSRTA
jgi:peptidoglycan/LPS O-acetylase OafA/YrhL